VYGRIIALDVGERRIGVAISDPLAISAQGLPTIERQNRTADLAMLRRLAQEHEAVKWLIGLPLHLSGTEGAQAEKVRAFGALVEKHTGLPVAYWDERLTTVQASRVLREAASTLAKRKKAIDRLSAVVLLQSYQDAQAQK
jgi:putative Holliday junction resolvase